MIRIIENLNESKKDKTESSLEKFFDEHGIKKPKNVYKTPIGFSE